MEADAAVPAVMALESEDGCNCGRPHGPSSHPHQHAAATSLAHQLWFPWRFIVLYPLPTLIAYLVFNALFVSIGWLFRLLASLITMPGVVLAVAIAITYGIYRLISLISYPGQLSMVIRDGEKSYARAIKRRIGTFIEALVEVATVLGDSESVSTTSTRLVQASFRVKLLQAQQNLEFAMESIANPLLDTLDRVEQDYELSSDGKEIADVLRDLRSMHTSSLKPILSDLVQNTTGPTKNKSLANTSTATSARDVVPNLAASISNLREAMQLVGPSEEENAASKRTPLSLAKALCQSTPPDVDSVATLDMMRASLSVQYGGEQVWIDGHNGHRIDAMFIPASSLQSDRPTVLFCNPNGGLYEFHPMQMDWFHFYTQTLECNMLLYNYRGYGRNVGSPSPPDNNLDAAAIVQYLKKERKVGKLAVHGESIGGLAAAYVARHCPEVDVMIADRTLSSLPALAQRLVGGWAGSTVRYVTRWDTDSTSNYLYAKCPKILCSDARDEVILDPASLKSGVALRVALQDELGEIPKASLRLDMSEPTKEDATDSNFSLSDWILQPVSVCTNSPLSSCNSTASTRQSSDAECYPKLGGPLSESMVFRFASAALSIGRRAMRYSASREADKEAILSESKGHVEVSMPDTTKTSSDSEGDSIAAQQGDGHLESSGVDSKDKEDEISHDTPLDPTHPLVFPDELVAVVWMQVACMDGYCGQCLLEAAEHGDYDRIRAWTASLLVWGGVVTPERRYMPTESPFECQGMRIEPRTIFQTNDTLQHIAEKHPNVKYDDDIGFLINMVQYFVDRIERKWKELDCRDKKKVLCPDETSLGDLLPLHCGHNKNFKDDEKERLKAFLRQVDFIKDQVE